MLNKLDEINWKELEHAYGPAEDVPGQIRALASTDPQVREKAQYELWGNIIHQGTIYQATSYAVPFLIELLEIPEVQDTRLAHSPRAWDWGNVCFVFQQFGLPHSQDKLISFLRD